MSEKDYDFVLESDEEGNVDLPEEVKQKDNSVTVRQPSSTVVYRKNSLQMYSSENDHLEATMKYFEAEVKVWGEDEKYLIKAEFPEEMSDELKAKIQSHINTGGRE